MTRNEKIAEKARWNIVLSNPQQLATHEITAYLSDVGQDTPAGHWLSHLLTQRMVDDGWEITINIGRERGWIEALRFDGDLYHRIGVDHQYHVAGNLEVLSEPAAIVELFCKVYEITEDEK